MRASSRVACERYRSQSVSGTRIYGNRSILGPPFRIMDEAPTDLWGWIVNIISATGAIVGILGIFVILFDLMGL